MYKFLKRLVLNAACLAMLACTSLEPLPNTDAKLRRTVHPGDNVEISKANGQEVKFEVDKVDSAGLHGSGNDVSFDDIKSISREETSWWKTGGLIGLGVVAAVLGVEAASHKSGGGGGGW